MVGGGGAFSFPISTAGELAKDGYQSLSVLEMTHAKNPMQWRIFRKTQLAHGPTFALFPSHTL